MKNGFKNGIVKRFLSGSLAICIMLPISVSVAYGASHETTYQDVYISSEDYFSTSTYKHESMSNKSQFLPAALRGEADSAHWVSSSTDDIHKCIAYVHLSKWAFQNPQKNSGPINQIVYVASHPVLSAYALLHQGYTEDGGDSNYYNIAHIANDVEVVAFERLEDEVPMQPIVLEATVTEQKLDNDAIKVTIHTKEDMKNHKYVGLRWKYGQEARKRTEALGEDRQGPILAIDSMMFYSMEGNEATREESDKAVSSEAENGSVPAEVLSGSMVEKEADELPTYYCLRDEYILPTENQTEFETCWAFTTAKCLQAALQIENQEYMNFSEAWIALCQKKNFSNSDPNSPTYTLGKNGSELREALLVFLNDRGLVSENEMPLDEMLHINNDNFAEYYTKYSNLADKNLYSKCDVTVLRDKGIKELKESIYKKTAINYNIQKGSITSKTVTAPNGKQQSVAVLEGNRSIRHAVTVIGWDDEFKLDESDRKGAFIALNSYGNYKYSDGIFYIRYDDVNSLIISKYAPNITFGRPQITSVNKGIQNNKVDAYSYSNNFEAKEKRVALKNIFEKGEPIDITYHAAGAKNVEVSVDGEEVTKEFIVENDGTSVHLRCDNPKNEVYTVTFTYGNDSPYKSQIFVWDYASIGYADMPLSMGDTSRNLSVHFNDDLNNDETLYFVNMQPEKAKTVRIYYPTYHKITGITLVGRGASIGQKSDKAFEINFDPTSVGVHKYSLKLTTKDGETITRNMKYYVGNDVVYASILRGDINRADLHIFENADSKYYLPTLPDKGNKTFVGWTCGNVELPKENDQYYIAQRNLRTANSYNYLTSKNPGGEFLTLKRYCVVEPKYMEKNVPEAPNVELAKKDLEVAIDEASKAKTAQISSVNGADIKKTAQWVTKKEQDSFENAIKKAKEIAESSENYEVLKEAVETLKIAQKTYGDARKFGTMEEDSLGNLEKERLESIASLKTYKSQDEYLPEHQNELERVIANGEKAINAARGREEILSSLTVAKAEIDQIETKAQALQKVKAIFKNAIHEATTLKKIAVSQDGKDIYTNEKWVTEQEAFDFAKAIETAESIYKESNGLDTLQLAIQNLQTSKVAYTQVQKNGLKAIVTPVPVLPSGGGGASGGGSAPSPTKPTTLIVPTIPEKTQQRVQSSVAVLAEVKNDTATIMLTEKQITDAIQKAQETAKQSKLEKNAISVEIKAETKGKDVKETIFNLPKLSLDKVVQTKVKEITLGGDSAAITLNLESVKEIQRQVNSDVQVSAKRIENASLSAEAKAVIGKRPVFELTVMDNRGKKVVSFGNGNVTVAIPYTLSKNEKADNVIAYYIDDKGKVTELPNSVYSEADQTLSFVTNHFSLYGVGYKENNASKFRDINSHWAKESIEFVSARGLLSGIGGEKFSPDTAMSRGMFVTALGRLAGADESAYKTSKFTDVKAGSYYLSYIEWANRNGIIKGSSDTTFTPDQSITREQMAVIMQNYAKTIGFTLPNVHAETTFADKGAISDYAKEAAKQMQMAGVLSGKSRNVFDPQGTATRAEVSAVLKRFVELAISTDNA